MNKKELDDVMRQMRAARWDVQGWQKRGAADYTVTAIPPEGGNPIVFDAVSTWDILGGDLEPQPGARLKYNEPTAQVSITVPVSVLAAADAGGRGKRSAWFVQAARAWMAREGAG